MEQSVLLQRVGHMPREPNPALLEHAHQRAESVQNRIADRITAFSAPPDAKGSKGRQPIGYEARHDLVAKPGTIWYSGARVKLLNNATSDVNGFRLHALVFGDGPRTLVAVGGWTGSWEVWEEPIAQLTARGWRCVAYDHRGSGKSPVDPTLITVGAMVDDVAGVLDALGIERCILAGESQGGGIAQYAAARSPQRFDGLVLSAPARTGRSEGGGGFAEACRADYPAAVDEFISACFPEPNSDHIKRWGKNILLRAAPEQAARIIEMWRDDSVPDVDPRQIAIPTLILHGTADVIVPNERSRQLAELLPDAELVEFEGSGHVPTMTRPDDVAAAILRRFL